MKNETKGILSLIFSIYGIINSPPLSLFLFNLPLRNISIIFLIIGIIFGLGNNKTKIQKIGFIVGIVGLVLILIGFIWALLFVR
jgi:hypothetical protein